MRAPRTRRLAVAVTVLLGVLLALPTGVASAAPESGVVPAPELTITSPANGTFIPQNTVTVSGTGTTADATVSVTADGRQVCTATVTASETGELTWSCTGSVPNGNLELTATENGATTAPTTVHVLGRPSISAGGPTTGAVSGSAQADAVVYVSAGGSGSCRTQADGGGFWSCVLTSNQQRLPSGVYEVSARQSHGDIGPADSFSLYASRSIQVDTTLPTPPVIVSPAGDYRLLSLPATFSGTGETGATITVSVDGIPVCSAPVVNGAWSCTGGSTMQNAAHQVRAVQMDAAGNISSPSPAIRVFFGPPDPPDTRRPAARPSATPTPSPTPSPSETAEPAPEAPPAIDPTDPGTIAAPPLPAGTAPDAGSNWGTPTTFGAGLPGMAESVERGNWSRAPLVALGFVALIALPSRLLASELRDRIRHRPRRPALRNREPVPLIEQHTTGVSPWLSAALPFAVTVAFMVVADGVEAEVRYLRLAAAVAGALGVLNLVGVTIASRLGHRWQGIDGRLRFRPLLLVAAIATGLLSRIVGVTPPFVSGTLIGVRMPHDTPVRGRALVNLLQVGTVLGLGLAGWIGHSLVGDVVGFWPSLWSEFLAALCLVGIGSTVVLLLPVGALPGRVLLEWNRWGWLAITLVSSTIVFGLLLGGSDSHWPLATLLIIAASVAAAFIAAWAVLRFLLSSPSDLR